MSRLSDAPIRWRLPESLYIHVPFNRLYTDEGNETGDRRHNLGEGRRNVGGLVGDAALIDRNSSCGERYLKPYLDPIEWHNEDARDPVKIADLGDYVDAKTANRWLPPNRRHLFCAVAQPPKPDWAYVRVMPDADGDGYWLLGWEWGDALLAAGRGDPFKTGRICYAIEVDRLRPVQSLRAILQGDIDLARSVDRVVDYVTTRRVPLTGRGRIEEEAE